MPSSSETPTDGPEADPEAYEQACLAETRKQLARVTTYEREPYQLHSVRLAGQYPDTRIVVTLWDTRFDKEVHRSYSVWQQRTFVGYKGIRADPESVGMFVTTWSLGG